jgi:alkylhydroperoxidase/carboxymuconolactone decarboxylase family protein YurZ
MYLPKIYENFVKNFPEVFKAYRELGVVTRKAGPLDDKAQDLVKLGIAIGANSRGGVMSHTRKALNNGMTKDDIIHAVLLGLTTIGFPNMIAALGWIEEVLNEKQD